MAMNRSGKASQAVLLLSLVAFSTIEAFATDATHDAVTQCHGTLNEDLQKCKQDHCIYTASNPPQLVSCNQPDYITCVAIAYARAIRCFPASVRDRLFAFLATPKNEADLNEFTTRQ